MVVPLNIAVMLGGPSAEREVSLRSGRAVAQALRGLGHAVSEVDPQADTWSLPTATDVVFLALHGTYGEDGTVQRRLEALEIPYTGCDAEASRIAFDKVLTKQRCDAEGVRTAKYVVIRDPEAGWPAGWEPPLVIKPVRQGSSVGLQFLDRKEDWRRLLEETFLFDREVLVEETLAGREVTVGILAGQALPVVEVRPKHGTYDYRNKYTVGATEYFCPAEFDPGVTAAIQQAGLRAFKAIGGRDYSRVDAIVLPTGEPVILEVNTLPGMTETSLLPKAAAAAGIAYPQLCQQMVELALARSSRL